MKKILVTGAAGFIGSHLCKRLLKEDYMIIGIDNLNDYYDPSIKEERLEELRNYPNFVCCYGDITDYEFLHEIFQRSYPDIVVHLAAQVGVRNSIEHPEDYAKANLDGFFEVLNLSKHYAVEHFLFASSSSVYGEEEKVPYTETDPTDKPVSFYAATKKANELMAHAYSKVYDMKNTGLRFFTVYGPSGRPDMAYYQFTEKLMNEETISLYHYGNCKRDFTYIDDAVEGITKIIQNPTEENYSVYNIGNHNPVSLMNFVLTLQWELKKQGLLPSDYNLSTHVTLEPLPKGDVPITYADTSLLKKDYDWEPNTSLEDGLSEFVKWYKEHQEKKAKTLKK